MDDKCERVAGTVASGQSCQVCGAETRGDDPLCDSCSNTVDTIADTPLPPIPDGGLSRAMPGWLRLAPHSTIEAPELPQPVPNEFASILSDEDIPLWLKRMAERHAAENAPPVNLAQSTEAANPPIRAARAEAAAPAPAAPERRVMVGATLPRPIDPAPTISQQPRRKRLAPVEIRTAIGVGILVAIAALVILAIVLFG